MLTEIIDKYKRFADALVLEIIYKLSDLGSINGSGRFVNVDLQTFNYQKNAHEKVRLTFIDVIKFNFFESKKINSTVVFEAYINKTEEIIIFDFFALQIDGRDQLAEDPNSTFVIHCRNVAYEVLESPNLV